MAKLLLLDRDGTITQNRVRPGDYINDPSELELIPGVLERLEQYNRDGWTIFVVSNQGGVEKGFIKLEQCIEGMKRTIDLSEGLIKFAYFCPDAYPSKGENVSYCGYHPQEWMVFSVSTESTNYVFQRFRKPNPGMIQLAIANYRAILGSMPTEILMVGDMDCDRDAAQNAGVPFMWAENWRKGK